MSKKLKPIPKFKNEDEERKFWAKANSSDYFDWSKAVKSPSLPNLKPSTCSISLRLPESLLDALKQLANKRDIPYQSLLKILLAQKIKEETKITI